MSLDEILGLAPVIPVLIIEDVAYAVPLGRALVAGGLPVLEITLRTPVAMDCLERMAGEVEGGVVGAGTVLNPAMRRAAAAAGARFCVSPGLIEGETAGERAPLLPGIATATELIAGLAAGFTNFKLFPANVVGGIEALKAFASPFQQARFCPTGGVNAANAADYLALPNVVCVGGSWVAPAEAIRAGDWGRITALAREAAALGAG
ncbi:bifunctional 4-hydroxy-2-oxoglutarate aldolase/2-dehydro-3-deoxy-phosphogluconate aldolase [Phenylobacterium sp.]|uniref:bifunctional 4-hydroxy-2-oxoglutarate aldolase/2-dehydro-3-deoxy-phosphogluconate aldolase n=1 Tax=Phenylobacterium sp. TaxID=1871053 RepID=UPI0011FBCA73|nr:bifunctional 4-hydroxy-2-oxoglutarate aldolase/2-dehydro-3-deoxy-phosphogluconate aldolase [Phenylobacterium sp.]THD61867.1 MAG: bifunctional 4-hydroxy-2-oxoglutarate aldolase/2-dehydro-3-deoxy-phosphogluconate aldolase [Phenylobacterium sp.]